MTTQTASIPVEAGPVEAAQTRQRRRFTVSDYYAMADAGILAHTERVELLDGEIIIMAPIGSRHAFCVAWLNGMLVLALAERAIVYVQNPITLDSGSEPQPDIAVVVLRDGYANAHPGPDDVLLLIEVADSTLDADRNEKLPLYARAGIPEIWIVNLRDRRVEVCTEPVDGAYANVRHCAVGDSVAPRHFPDIALPVERIIPA